IAGRTARAERLLDERAREARAADAVRIHDIRLTSVDARDLVADDRGIERRGALAIRRGLEENDEEMARVMLRVGPERFARGDRCPFAREGDEEVDVKTKMPLRLRPGAPLERIGALAAPEHDVAALQQGARLVEAQRRRKIAQRRHRDAVAPAK